MNRDLICIICPRGCSLNCQIEGESVKVIGNACPRGEEYGISECLHPTRTITSVIRVSNREDTMVSVKTAEPIAKSEIFDIMERIRVSSVKAPIKIGDVLIKDIFGTDVIATKNID